MKSQAFPLDRHFYEVEFSVRLAVTVIVSLLVVFVIGVVMISVELSTIVVELSGVV